MIAKITRAKDAAALARVLHGPGVTRGHEYRDERGAVVAGGKVIAGTVPCLDPFSGGRGRSSSRGWCVRGLCGMCGTARCGAHLPIGG